MSPAARTIQNRPEEIPISLDKINECPSFIRNIADALDDADSAESAPPEQARCDTGEKSGNRRSLHDLQPDQINPRRGSVSPRPQLFRFAQVHADNGAVEFRLILESSKSKNNSVLARSSPI
jgi:hypothetical protein